MKKKTMMFICLLSVGTAFASNASIDKNNVSQQNAGSFQRQNLQASFSQIKLFQDAWGSAHNEIALRADGSWWKKVSSLLEADSNDIVAALKGCGLMNDSNIGSGVAVLKFVNSVVDFAKKIKDSVELKANFIENLRKCQAIVGDEIFNGLLSLVANPTSKNAVLVYVAFEKKLCSFAAEFKKKSSSSRVEKAMQQKTCHICVNFLAFRNALLFDNPVAGLREFLENKDKRCVGACGSKLVCMNVASMLYSN